jgi:hypothetical protein
MFDITAQSFFLAVMVSKPTVQLISCPDEQRQKFRRAAAQKVIPPDMTDVDVELSLIHRALPAGPDVLICKPCSRSLTPISITAAAVISYVKTIMTGGFECHPSVSSLKPDLVATLWDHLPASRIHHNVREAEAACTKLPFLPMPTVPSVLKIHTLASYHTSIAMNEQANHGLQRGHKLSQERECSTSYASSLWPTIPSTSGSHQLGRAATIAAQDVQEAIVECVSMIPRRAVVLAHDQYMHGPAMLLPAPQLGPLEEALSKLAGDTAAQGVHILPSVSQIKKQFSAWKTADLTTHQSQMEQLAALVPDWIHHAKNSNGKAAICVSAPTTCGVRLDIQVEASHYVHLVIDVQKDRQRGSGFHGVTGSTTSAGPVAFTSVNPIVN